MKNGIPEDIYYQLLVWKDENSSVFHRFTDFITLLGNNRPKYSLNDLSPDELKLLYRCIYNTEMPMGESGGEEFKPSHS